MTRLPARIALALFSVLLAVVAVEQLLRLAGYRYRPMKVEAAARGDARAHHLFEDDHFVYDPEMIWRPRQGVGVFNSVGLRGPELPVPKPPGEVWIFTVGDSNTLGWHGEEGAHWPGSLARLLDAEGRRVRVFNAGVWGYTSYQGLARTRQVLDLGADVVLISFGSNDALRVLRSDREFARRSLGSWRVVRWLGRFRVGELLIAAWDRLADPAARDLRPRVDLDEYADNLREMARLVRARGAEPVFLTRPFVGAVADELWWKNFAPDYNRATATVAEEEGALLIDVYSFFKGLEPLFADESHFTGEGHERAARIVLDHLRPLLDRP